MITAVALSIYGGLSIHSTDIDYNYQEGAIIGHIGLEKNLFEVENTDISIYIQHTSIPTTNDDYEGTNEIGIRGRIEIK
jgi:hypothetical protein